MLKDALRHSLRLFADSDETPAWLDCIAIEDGDDAVRVVFPHAYFGAYFAPYRERFEQALRHALARAPLRICYDVRLPGRRLPRRPAAAASAEAMPAGDATQDFESFLYNDKNAFAVAGARLMLHTDTAPPLLVLYGESGTGKSHLLHALHRELRAATARVAVFSLARQGHVRFPWEDAPGTFWQGYDALLLDDLHDILDNGQRCRALTACMDVAARTGKRLALALTGSLRRLEAAPPALRTRLEAGLLLELLPPDADVRLCYVQRQCREWRLPLSAPAMMRIAGDCAHIRRIQGTLYRLSTLSRLREQPPTDQDVETLLRGAAPRRQDYRDIMEAVARQCGLHADDLASDKRHPRLVLARQIAMYVCRRNLGLSYPELGRAFGGRDHSTVIHAVKKIEKMLVNDKNVHNLVASVAAKVEK